MADFLCPTWTDSAAHLAECPDMAPGGRQLSTNIKIETKTIKTFPQRPSLKVNALSNWVALCVNIAIGFFLTPAIVAHLDEKRFGMWILASSVVGYFGLLQFGVGTGVLRYVPLYRGTGDKARVSSVVSTAMALYVGMGLLAFIASWCFADLISNFFEGGPEFALLVRIVGLAAALQFPVLIFDAAIKGYEGFVYANLVGLISAITRMIALFGCIILGYGLIVMGWALVIVNVVAVLAGAFAFRCYCSDVKLSLRAVKLVELKTLLYFGLTIMACGFAQLLTFDVPQQIVGKVISLEAVGFFGVVALLVMYYRRAIYALTKVFMPRFSYLSGRDDRDANKEIRGLFLRGTKYATILASAIAMLIWAVGPSFLRLWISKNFDEAVPALIILASGTLVLLSHRMSIDLLYGLGKQVYIATVDIIEGVAVFVLCLILSFKYGLTGVAIGVSVPIILIRGLVQTNYVCQLIKVNFWWYYGHCILKPWLVSIVIGVLVWAFGMGRYAQDWISLFVATGMLLLIYSNLIYFIVFERTERAKINCVLSAAFKYVRS